MRAPFAWTKAAISPTGLIDHRLGSRLIGERQIALQPRRIEIGIAGCDDEQRIDIGGGKLLVVAAFRATLKQRPTLKAPLEMMVLRIDPTSAFSSYLVFSA